MTAELSRSTKLIDLCLRTLALDERAQLDRASIRLLKRSLGEAETAAVWLRAQRGSPDADEGLGHIMVVCTCIRGLLERGVEMDLEARRRVLDAALERLHQLDELADSLE